MKIISEAYHMHWGHWCEDPLDEITFMQKNSKLSKNLLNLHWKHVVNSRLFSNNNVCKSNKFIPQSKLLFYYLIKLLMSSRYYYHFASRINA